MVEKEKISQFLCIIGFSYRQEATGWIRRGLNMKSGRVMVIVAVLAGTLFLAGPLWSATGPLWTQAFNFQPDRDTIVIGALAASPTAIIVCGTAYKANIDTGDIGFIKAFDQTPPGNLKWEKTLTTGLNRNSFNSLAVVGNMVLAEGYSSSYTIDSTGYLIYTLNQSSLQAINADTGDPIWGPINQTATPVNLGPTNLVTANNRVFVVLQEKGVGDISGTTGDCIVEAYEGGTPIVGPTSLLLE